MTRWQKHGILLHLTTSGWKKHGILLHLKSNRYIKTWNKTPPNMPVKYLYYIYNIHECTYYLAYGDYWVENCEVFIPYLFNFLVALIVHLSEVNIVICLTFSFHCIHFFLIWYCAD